MNQGTRQGKFLLHTTREFACTACAEWFYLLVDRLYKVIRLLDSNTKQSSKELQILLNRQIGIEREATRHIAHALSDGKVISLYITSIDRGTALIWINERGE